MMEYLNIAFIILAFASVIGVLTYVKSSLKEEVNQNIWVSDDYEPDACPRCMGCEASCLCDVYPERK